MRFFTSITAFMLSCAMITTVQADEQVLDFDTQHAMPAELATVAVLGELCPTLIETDDAFTNGYHKVIKELLPNAKNPVAEFKLLTESPEYKDIMATERAFALQAGDAENQEICIAIQEYGR
ncbi:MCR_0457 family protein [Moraxella sp. ZY210820]|uniref:MCR_0457 family protein n=1 Tax=unclassified Moraxella TaxID=2685852 RepID=UPI002731BCBC|nr:hypothetical protein [Moraxella sp. ZY210820]WLF83084.1 hypothetical protein LU301_07345 [Moraxella sp. ZY210820]